MTFLTDSPFLATAAFLSLPLMGLGHMLWMLGAFRSITFEKGRLGPSRNVFVYKTGKGPFSGVGPHFQEMEKFLADHGFGGGKNSTETPPPLMAGIYYDDPKTTKVPRYAVGFLVDKEDTVSWQKWERIRDSDVAKKFSVLEILDTPTIVSSFPLRWRAMSCVLSAMKTYPAFKKTDYKLNCGSMEIYRTDLGIVETHFPQANVDQFNPQESDSFAESGTDEKKVK